ncbi:MAG: head-tail adaptor protein [Anaerolineae bacterium]|nr:head-tail adaptor protein [Anaerolineae bacterium]
MSVFSAADIARMRATAELIFDQTCMIERGTITNDGQGGWSESWGTVAGTVACRLGVMSGAGDIREGASRREYSDVLVLRVAYDQDIAQTDRVTINTDVYQVEELLDEHQWMMVKRARVTKVNDA